MAGGPRSSGLPCGGAIVVGGQGAAGVSLYVAFEHPLDCVRLISCEVVVHAWVSLHVVELGVRALVGAEHHVAVVAGPDVVVVAEREVGPGGGLPVSEQHGEVLAFQLLPRLYTEKAEYRRRDIVGGGVIVARLASPPAFRMPYKERYVRNLGP